MNQQAAQPSFQRFHWLAGTLIALAALAAFADSFRGRFLFDDLSAIAANPTIRHWWSALSPPAATTVGGRPVLNLSFACNYALSGPAEWSYHAVNLAIHIGAGLILFGIVRRTLTRAAVAGGARSCPADILSFAVALLWTVHPLQAESVTYLVQRAESLMGLFYLLTLYGFIRGAAAEEKASGRPAGFGWYLLSVVACLLGMGTKEAMVTAPLIVFLYDRTFVAGSWREAWRLRRNFHLALAATWVVLAGLVAANPSRGGTAGFQTAVPWWAYALTQFRAIAHYLRLAFWPRPLIADYGRILGGPPLEVGLDAAMVLILAAASFRLLLRPGGGSSPGRSLLGFAGAWFFVILAPSSSVVPVATEIIAEHRMYLPLAAVIAVAVCGGYALVARALPRARADGRAARPYLMVCVGAAVALGCTTARRNLDYRDNLTLWSDIVAKVPENAGAHNNLGNIFFEQGRLAEAIDEYRQALQLVPDYADAHFNLGNALVGLGRLPDAIENYRAALRYRPEDPAIHAALGTACYRRGNAAAEGNRPEEAAAAYAEAVAEQPNFADARVNYGNILAELGRVAEAVAEYEQVLRLEPSSADAHNNLGSLLAGQGRLREARAQFEEALRLQPDYRAARDNLRRLETIAPPPRAP